MTPLTLPHIQEFRKKRNQWTYNEETALLGTCEAALKVVEAAKKFKSESDNPVPDLALKARYRKELYEYLAPFQAPFAGEKAIFRCLKCDGMTSKMTGPCDACGDNPHAR